MPICDHADAYEPGHDCPQSRAFWDALANQRAIEFTRGVAHARPLGTIGADTDSLGYPAALGYDQPDPDDYTGPDLDVDAVIAAANDATRSGAIRHDYLAALAERGAIRATSHRGTGDTNHGISDAQHAARYLDDEPGDPFYD